MKIVKSKIIPLPGFVACNLFGVLFCRPRTYDRIQRGYNKTLINHEEIHTAQMKEMLYIPFYIWYGIEHLCKRWNYTAKEAYRAISFEREAYNNQDNLNYLKERKHYSWFNLLNKEK